MGVRRAVPVLLTGAMLIAPPASAATKQVEIDGLTFLPATVTVAPGDRVRWSNEDPFGHTATRSGVGGWSLSIPADGAKQRVFRQSGAFAYVCTVPGHAMSGTVKVRVRVSPRSGTAATTFTIRVATVDATPGTEYVVQRKAPGGTFKPWRSTTAQTVRHASAVKGTWRFRAAIRRTADGTMSGFSPAGSATIS